VECESEAVDQTTDEASGLQEGVLLEIKGGLGEVGGAAEVAPVVLVGAEG
jgi:hypothetical protein